MRITLSDIAAKVGVSKKAVSLALQGSARISTQRRLEIERIAAEMGYAPDPFLSGLARYRGEKLAAKSQAVIAWLNRWEKPERLRYYKEFDLYWRGAREAAKEFGYRVEEFIWPVEKPAEEMERQLLDRGVLGVLIPPHRRETNWGNFDWSKFSVMRFGMSVARPDSNLVTSDHLRAIIMAMQKIYSYGYRRIGFVLDDSIDDLLGGNYQGGFLWVQELLKLEPIPLLKIPPPPSPSATAEFNAALDKWLRTHKPEAVLTWFIELPGSLRKLGYRVPKDIAVAATSISDISADAGIDQRSKAIGRVAVEMLVKQISLNERGERLHPCRILLESRWKDGKSLPRRQ